LLSAFISSDCSSYYKININKFSLRLIACLKFHLIYYNPSFLKLNFSAQIQKYFLISLSVHEIIAGFRTILQKFCRRDLRQIRLYHSTAVRIIIRKRLTEIVINNFFVNKNIAICIINNYPSKSSIIFIYALPFNNNFFS